MLRWQSNAHIIFTHNISPLSTQEKARPINTGSLLLNTEGDHSNIQRCLTNLRKFIYTGTPFHTSGNNASSSSSLSGRFRSSSSFSQRQACTCSGVIDPMWAVQQEHYIIEIIYISSSNRSPYRIQCDSSSNRFPHRIQCNSSSNRSPHRIQCNSSYNRSPYSSTLTNNNTTYHY